MLDPGIITAAASTQGRAFAIAAGVGVHLNYLGQLKRKEAAGVPIWSSTQAATRVAWAQHVFATSGWLYAIQTLRNAITANTFLASTMVSLFTFITGFLYQVLIKDFQWRVLLQFSSVAALLLCSAYEFLQSARLMTHAGFMFPVAADDCAPSDGAGQLASLGPRPTRLTQLAVEKVMYKSEITQWAGLRFLYLAVNASAWILGGEWVFCLACLLMTRFFVALDRPPALTEDQGLGC